MPHRHRVEDADMSFRIDADTRAIINQSPVRKKLIQYDHKSERFTFEIPKTVDGHDMSLCDKIEIHYMNVGSNINEVSADAYVVDDMHVSEDGKLVIFTWLIKRSATRYAGSLTFMIRFLCHNEEDLIVYSWGTEMYKGISIGDAYNNGSISYSDDLRETTSVSRMVLLDSDAMAENINRPFSGELHQALIDRDRVYIEDGGNKGVSPLYYLSANADAQFNPWGYVSIEAMCEDYADYKWTPETVVKETHYVESTVDGKTTYHPRLFSVVARTLDGSVRGITNDKSSDDTLTNKGFVTGKLGLKIDKNSISTSDTTPHRDQDKVLYRAKNGGNYSGIPVAVNSVVNDEGVAARSIPRFNENSELIGSTRNTSYDGEEVKDAMGTVVAYTNGALVNLGYAKKLINGAIENHNHDNDYADIDHKHDGTYAAADHNHDDAYGSKSDLKKYSLVGYANTSGAETDVNAKNSYSVLMLGDKGITPFMKKVDGSNCFGGSIAQRMNDGSLMAKMRASTDDAFAATYGANTLINYEYLNYRLSSSTVYFNPSGAADIPQRSVDGELRCKMPTAPENTTVVNKEYLDSRLTAKQDALVFDGTYDATNNKVATISSIPTTLPASDVYAWAKASTKPTYTASEVGALATSDVSDWAKASTKPTYTASEVGALATSDVYAWAKASTKPTYTASEVGALAASDVSDWAKASTKPTYDYTEIAANDGVSFEQYIKNLIDTALGGVLSGTY